MQTCSGQIQKCTVSCWFPLGQSEKTRRYRHGSPGAAPLLAGGAPGDSTRSMGSGKIEHSTGNPRDFKLWMWMQIWVACLIKVGGVLAMPYAATDLHSQQTSVSRSLCQKASYLKDGHLPTSQSQLQCGSYTTQ